jgi:dihydropteroate synthase
MPALALLEPLLGLTELPQTFADSSPGMEADDSLWTIRLTRWQKEWGTLPDGLEMVLVDGVTHCVGRLSRYKLDLWVQQLKQDGLKLPATSLENSIKAHTAPAPVWQWGRQKTWRLDFSKPQVMGIINVTRNSFSGDGITIDQAIKQGLQMADQGADILDVGGESTRPGASRIEIKEELAQTVPVVKALAEQLDIPISIDSSKPEVMAAAMDAGAAIINDVTALRNLGDETQEKETLKLLAESDCPIILMHMQGEPNTMQQAPQYSHVMSQVYGFLAERIEFCLANGISRQRIVVDPGIGFGKLANHNLELMRRQRILCGLGTPLLLGLSRKRIVGSLTGEPIPKQRDMGSHLLAAFGYMVGANIFRVHDVQGACQALSVAKGWRKGLESAPCND